MEKAPAAKAAVILTSFIVTILDRAAVAKISDGVVKKALIPVAQTRPGLAPPHKR